MKIQPLGISNNQKPTKNNTPAVTTPPRQNLWSHFLNFQEEQDENDQINTQGTMTGLLQSNKRTKSPLEEKNDQKKKKIIPYEQIDDNIEHYNDNIDISDNITDRDEDMQDIPNQTHNPVRSQSIRQIVEKPTRRNLSQKYTTRSPRKPK